MDRTRTAKDYLDLLDEGTGLLLVGGQAVNLWAERYQADEAAILAYQPFTSRDADFYRRAQKLRLPPNWTELPRPSKGRMRIVSHALQGPEGQKAEVIRTVNGLTDKELDEGSIPIEYAGTSMWFLVPPTLFQAKLENLISLNQEGRQDFKHFKLLILVTRCFFKDMLKQHSSTTRPTKAISWMSQHASNIRKAIRLGYQPRAGWETFSPMETMANHPSEAVRNFAALQLKPTSEL